MRWPGIEPGSTAWKATMLTTIPPSLVSLPSGEPTSHFSLHEYQVFSRLSLLVFCQTYVSPILHTGPYFSVIFLHTVRPMDICNIYRLNAYYLVYIIYKEGLHSLIHMKMMNKLVNYSFTCFNSLQYFLKK